MHRLFLGVVGVLLLAASVEAQTTVVLPDCRVTGLPKPYADGDFRLTVRCEKNGTQKPVVGDKAQILRVVVAPPPSAPVNCAGTWTSTTELTACENGSQHQIVTNTFTVTTQPANGGTACPASPQVSDTAIPCAVEPPPPPPPPPTGTIVPARETDPEVLGQCSAETHDKHTLVGIDGKRYYTWHPQRDPSGCVYGHEHGHDPAPARAAIIAWAQSRPVSSEFTQARKDALILEMQQPILFGYIQARAAGHPAEPHAGFKQFYTIYGECNEEGRCSQMLSEHTTHMGTFGVGRFTQRHHSVRKLQIHVPSGSYEVTQGMFDFGGADMVCDPRQSPTRDFITLNSRCRINSAYEIWQGTFTIHDAGKVRYRGIATPAVFDAITVRNPANESEVVYAWDPRVVQTTRAFSTPSWADHRGSDREAYAQPAYFEVTGHHAVWADVMTGQIVPAGTAGALPQFFYSPQTGQNLRGSTAVSSDGSNGPNHAFKVRRPNNDLRQFLGLKN